MVANEPICFHIIYDSIYILNNLLFLFCYKIETKFNLCFFAKRKKYCFSSCNLISLEEIKKKKLNNLKRNEKMQSNYYLQSGISAFICTYQQQHENIIFIQHYLCFSKEER